MTEKKSRKRPIVIAISVIAAASAILLQVWPMVGPLIGMNADRQANTPITTTTTKPVLTIKPLPVRPVVSAFVTTPDKCPPPDPVPPDKPMRICDVNKTAVYELQPEALRLQLVNVDSFRNPLTGVEMVQVTMTPESAQEFSKFTAGQIGKQVALVRGGVVVYGPKITEAIDGQVLQLSGELTPEQAKEIARKLKDEA